MLHSGALTMVPILARISHLMVLHVGTMVNAELCSSLYLFPSFLCHPYILTILVENFYYF